MSLSLRVVLLLVSVAFLLFALRRASRNRHALRSLLLWIFLGVLGLLAAVFPNWVFAAADFLGFEKPVNFLFFVCVAFLMVVALLAGVQASREADKSRVLVQEMALLSNRLRKVEAALAERNDERPAAHPGGEPGNQAEREVSSGEGRPL